MGTLAHRHLWKLIIGAMVVLLGVLWLAPRFSRQEQILTPPVPVPAAPLPAPLEKPQTGTPATKQALRILKGKASFYGGSFHGRRTANGERYDQQSLTAAHRTLPMGTWVKVRNLRNGREVVVRINNRGPYIKGRIIDLSTRAAREIRMTDAGVVPVEVTVLGKEKQPSADLIATR